MKQLFNFALIGAIALTSATMFVGCNSSEDAVETNNPNYNEKTDEVNVQFVLNVAANTGDNTTRQGAATVQKSNNFRGLKDAKLIALKTGNPTWLAPFDGSASTSMDVKTFELGTLYTSSQITDPDNKNPGERSNRILQLSLPTGMDAMLVYARAIPGGVTEEDGKVEMNVTAAPENTTFSLQSRLGTNQNAYDHTLALSAAIFNYIMDAEIKNDVPAGDGVEINGYTNTALIEAFKWYDLGKNKSTVDALTGLPEILGKDYLAITTLTDLTADPATTQTPNEYRAGSSEAVRHLIYHIYTDCTGILGATATTDKEYAAQLLAKEIQGRIDRYFSNAGNETTIAFLTVSTSTSNNIPSHLQSDLNMTPETYNTNYSGVTDTYMAGFPSCFGLPDGVALMTIDENKDFTYQITNATTLLSGMTNASQYMYPAELLYFDNSALRCNTASVAANAYPDGYNTWDDNDSWDGWTVGNPGGIVSSSTRSVAVKNNINYGVAMLKTAVALEGSTFNDNRNAFTGEADQALTTTNVSGFKLTGVLVGGQNNQMRWDYLAKEPTADANWNYVVYDNKIENGGTIPTASSKENYTLLFDNYNFKSTQDNVYVALEFENNGIAFYGEHNLIPVGGKFYLVGKLELGSNTIDNNQWDQYYPVPPYTAEGASQKITRIFIQDFMTSATFKIGANSLKKAFNTIPDLRSTQTSLGLSVNLEWKQGLVFDDVELGH